MSESKELSGADTERLVNKAYHLDFSGFVVWTGGEPFLSFNSLLPGLKRAADSRFRSEILTGGRWEDYHVKMKAMRDISGISIRISIDREHQERCTLDRLLTLIDACLTFNIQVNFTYRQILPDDSDILLTNLLQQIKNQFPVFYESNRSNSRWVNRIPQIDTGISWESVNRVETVERRSLIKKRNPIGINDSNEGVKRCRMAFRDMVIGSDGLVYPCCGLFSIPRFHRFHYGNALEESWEAMAKRFEHPSFFSDLILKGLQCDGFDNICSACLNLLRAFE